MKSTRTSTDIQVWMKDIIWVYVQESSTRIKAMNLFSAARTPPASTWIPIFWLILADGVTVCPAMQLQTTSPVAARCGENVTLTCDVNSTQALDIKLFSWVGPNGTVCGYEKDRTDHQFQCEFTKNESFHPRLKLTLFNIMPISAGKYTCKLHSNIGIISRNTSIKVQGYSGTFSSFLNESHASCSFNGVFPSGLVHWFQGSVNLTVCCSTEEEEEDQNGLYNIRSTIQKQKGNLNQPYECSLWIPSLSKYHSLKRLMVRSSGRAVRLQWICAVMEVIMVKLIL